jgi:hypothetical protein
MTDLGSRQASGTLDSTGANPFGNGLWVVAFTPTIWARATGRLQVYGAVVSGVGGLGPAQPAKAAVYIETAQRGNVPRVDTNEYDPQNPYELDAGETLFFYYSVGTAPKPMITVWIRTPPELS